MRLNVKKELLPIFFSGGGGEKMLNFCDYAEFCEIMPSDVLCHMSICFHACICMYARKLLMGETDHWAMQPASYGTNFTKSCEHALQTGQSDVSASNSLNETITTIGYLFTSPRIWLTNSR